MAHTSSPGAQQGPHAPGMHVRPVLWHWGLLEAAQCLPAECSQVVLPVPLITPPSAPSSCRRLSTLSAPLECLLLATTAERGKRAGHTRSSTCQLALQLPKWSG